MKWNNTYHQLGGDFYQAIDPLPVANPTLFVWNDSLGEQLQIPDYLQQDAAQYFSGNRRIKGSQPIATAYAGHQFGQLNPQLGDGRAHLLGELLDQHGHRVDIQLKGSGATRFSRRGDGRCAFKPALREYVMSEAMHALGIATTRSLAVIRSGESVYREYAEPGAILVRTASSHIRFGSFEYFSAKGDIDSLKILLDYAIERHFSDQLSGIAVDDHKSRVIGFLQAVMAKQIETLVHWARIGFIHGVMNTDNMTISGETIDYGPCAMMGTYHPDTVYSSIDSQGRYSFANQPRIAQWNLARLAESLFPLLGEDEPNAVGLIGPYIVEFWQQYQVAYYQMMANKIGLIASEAFSREKGRCDPLFESELFSGSNADRHFIDQLLDAMQRQKLDYTQTFVRLMQAVEQDTAQLALDLGDWYYVWRKRILAIEPQLSIAKMRDNNPLVIARNHHVEAVLDECQTTQTAQGLERFLRVLRRPYTQLIETENYQDTPANGDVDYQTFCGT